MELLSVRNLSVRFGSKSILEDVSFNVLPTEIVSLVGPNGSGKSTLLRAVIGMIGSSGSVEWYGRSRKTKSHLHAYPAYVPQSPTMIEGLTVFESILFARSSRLFLRSKDVELVESIANKLELDDLLERRIETLSGGQRQRVFLARSLAGAGSSFLVLDEPASFLDLKHQIDLHRRLRKLTKESGHTVLMASHDLNLVAQHADRMILLHEGKIAAQGTPSEVLDPVLISRVFETPMKRIDVDGKPMLVVSDKWPEFRRS